jgi:chemotaxis family two-component system sensor kinase Cph1
MNSPALQISDRSLTSLKQPAINTLTQVQPHGAILVLKEPDMTVLQISRNVSKLFGRPAEDLIGKSLEDILDSYQADRFLHALAADNLDLMNPTKVWVRRVGDDYGVFDAIVHRSADGFLVLELEPALLQENIPFLGFYHLAKVSINQLERGASLNQFFQMIVTEVRKVTGFDRVMLYRFDQDGHGEVMAEDKIAELESYMGLHFPESDIPAPARKMFVSNWIRTIPDATAEPVDLYPEINPVTNLPTDLIQSILRSPYPCHLKYLENMGVGSSLTISLMKDQKLWGLIACHHRTPRQIPYELRKACEFLGRMIFSEIANREEEADTNYRMQLSQTQALLIDAMSREDSFIDALVQGDPNLLDLANASGAAICFNGRWTTLGLTPNEEELTYLAQWLSNNVSEDVYYTDSLPRIYFEAERFKDIASGLLAIPISKRSFILWFRPEVIQTVNWGGDPNNAYHFEGTKEDPQLCPRQSFALWKETVQLKSLPWQPVEIRSVLEFRKAVVNIVLRQAEELALLAQDLERSNAELKKFAYVASHDLQEPLNQVANYVQLLEMRYDDALDEDAKDFINFAVDGVGLMQTLIDDVLAYSKVDVKGIECALTNVEESLTQAIANLRGRIADTQAEVTYDPMPTLVADSTQLMQLFQNLLGNAIKFRRADVPPRIHIGVERTEDSWRFTVQDNGIGLDPQFGDRIFVIFQRLHTRDEYPGSGMGLAICKKIVECHRGQIWVESALGEGANFCFTLPVGGLDASHANRWKTQNYLFSGR